MNGTVLDENSKRIDEKRVFIVWNCLTMIQTNRWPHSSTTVDSYYVILLRTLDIFYKVLFSVHSITRS